MFINPFNPTSLFRFDAEKDGGGSTPIEAEPETKPEVPPEAKPAPTPTDGGDASGNDAGPVQPQQQPATNEIRLTPAQLADRLDRARQATLKQFGFDDSEALKKALKDGKAALDAKKTETERQAEALQQAQDQAQALEAQIVQLQAQAEQAALQVEGLGLMSGRFANPKAAMKLVDLAGVKRNEDGTFTGLKEAIDQLATNEPWTLIQPIKKPVAPQIGSTNPDGDGKKLTSDEERRSRYFGTFGPSKDFFSSNNK